MKKTSSPKRRGARLGQHFLTGVWAAAKLADAIEARHGETILEIGPGKGALTKELLKHGKVVAIEKDPPLVETLIRTFREEITSGKLHIIKADVRDFDTHSIDNAYIVAANIPYYITGEILRQFLTAPHQPRAMALLVQKEVAERVVAKNGKESLLSLSVQAFGEPRIIAKVSRGNFSPPPSVDSSILLVEDISRARFANTSEKLFFEVLHAGFASKRKQLAGNLARRFGKDAAARALTICAIPVNARAEDVPLEQWQRLTDSLA